MTEIQEVLNKLQGVKKSGTGWKAICPAHDDKVASLSVAEEDGKVLLYCHARCSFESIIKALDIHEESNTKPEIVATYDYTDSEGKLLYQVVRYHPKAFKHRRPDGQGGWIWNLKGITPTLYQLPRLWKAICKGEQVFIVEGEKDADNLMALNWVATTISGGASAKWHPSLVPLFQGARVVIIPDNDEPGRKYAHYVANLLYGWAEWVKVIALPDKDVSDYLEFNSIESLLTLSSTTSSFIPTGAVTREEFNELRGLNIYLLKTLLRQKNLEKYRGGDLT